MKIVVLLLTVLLGVTPHLIAANPKDTFAKHRDRPFVSKDVVVALKLSADQRAELATLQKKFERAQDAWMKAHRDERGQLREKIALARAAGDEAKLKELTHAWRTQFGPLNDIRKEYRTQLRDQLTESQRAKFDDLLAKQKD